MKKWRVAILIYAWCSILIAITGITISVIHKLKIMTFGAPLALITGIGLIKFKEWARKLTIFLSFFGVVFSFFIYFWSIFKKYIRPTEFSYLFNTRNIVQWIMAAAVIYFFTRPKIKEQFR